MALLESPIVLFCSERSGSNLIAKVFDAHSRVSAPGAAHLFKVMSEVADRYPPGSEDLRAAVVTLFRAKVSSWSIDVRSDTDLMELLKPLKCAGAMAAAFYRAEMQAAGKAHSLIKENSAFSYLAMITGQSVTPRILFMVRDPRDMAVSWVNGPVMRGGVVRAARRWRYDQEGYLRTLAQLPDKTSFSFLRYEDLLAAPEAELRRVCTELILPFEERLLDFSRVSSSAQKDATRSSMWKNLDRGILTGNSGKYANALNADEVAYIEAVTEPHMQAMGFRPITPASAPFRRFDNLAELEAHLEAREPHSKPTYASLPKSERDRFENWSRVTAEMRGRPLVSPRHFLPTRNTS